MLIEPRDAAKGQRVIEELRVKSGAAALELFVGDLSSMGDVRRIALEVRARHPKLDVLVNNVGGVFPGRQATVDSFERTFALNHLSYFLLTNLLRPNLEAAGRARVVGVSSSAQLMANATFRPKNHIRGFSRTCTTTSQRDWAKSLATP